MPSRKTAPRSSRPNKRAAAPKSSAAVRGAANRGPAGTSTGRRGPDEEFQNVTAEVQRRYDLEDDDVPTPPSSLNLDRHPSAARSGGEQMSARRRKDNAVTPEIAAGDVDADSMGAYFVGDEAATGDNPTPGQADVEEVGRAVGEVYQDNEELKFTDKVAKRDRHRWELDPASSEDYKERMETKRRKKG